MKQLFYILFLFIGFSAYAGSPIDSTTKHTQVAPLTVNGGSIRKVMGDRVYMKSTHPKVVGLKCKTNPNVFCAYVAKADGSDDGDFDPAMCPGVNITHVPDPAYSQQFPNSQRCYLGIPQTTGGIRYYEINSAKMECASDATTITIDPPIEIEE
jgi:hypothetical protein